MKTNMRLNISSADEAALEAELRKLDARESSERKAVSDDRRELHFTNRQLSVAECILQLKEELPAAIKHTQIVGNWVWVTFPGKPDGATREKLYDLGFHWNNKRKAWQHPCGSFSGHAKKDPRERYNAVPVEEREEVAA